MPKKKFFFKRNVSRPPGAIILGKEVPRGNILPTSVNRCRPVKKQRKVHQSHSTIDLVQAGRMRVPETVDSAALLQYGRQAYQYSEYSDGNRHHRAETQ